MAEKVQNGTKEEEEDDDDEQMGGGGSHRGRKMSVSASLHQRETERKKGRKRER